MVPTLLVTCPASRSAGRESQVVARSHKSFDKEKGKPVCHAYPVEDFNLWFGMVANSITILAGLIAITGVVWAFLGRARLDVTPQFIHPSVAPSISLMISSVGSNPVRALELIVGVLDDRGFSKKGGDIGHRVALNRGETLSLIVFERGEVSFGEQPRAGEYRFEIGTGEGFYLNVQWQSPLFPWRRSSRTYAWPPARRFASEGPEVLTGRKEIRFLKRTRDLTLNPMPSGSSVKSGELRHAIVATDETFDEIVSAHKGPVFVGYGPTWQGKWWEDVKRVLDVLALRHSPRVKVLVVNIDECPVLATRFEMNELPVFKMLLQGKVVKSYTGPHSVPDLEREFAGLL